GLSRGLAKLYEDAPQNWEEMIDTNVKGLLYVTRSVVPGMVARGRGHVINLGSTAPYIPYANGAVYCASKAAEKSISEGLKIDLMGTPVRVTSVDAGMVETNFSKVRFRGDEDRAAKVYQNITPLQPEDIADAIVWAATRPAHVNIHTVVMTTIDQANSTVFYRHGWSGDPEAGWRPARTGCVPAAVRAPAACVCAPQSPLDFPQRPVLARQPDFAVLPRIYSP